MTPLTDLHRAHIGRTIWVICSGASLSYVRHDFFADKLCIGVNETFRDFPTLYQTGTHHDHIDEALAAGCRVVVPAHACGFLDQPRIERDHPDLYTFPHAHNDLVTPFTADQVDTPDRLFLSASSAAVAIHLAYYLGASAIMLCGMDGGLLDGHMNYPGYNRPEGEFAHCHPERGYTWAGHPRLTAHIVLALIEAVRARGVHVHSLNPFFNFTLEDHRFASLSEDLATTRSFLTHVESAHAML